MDPEPYDVLAVELSSFQLHYTHSMSAESAAVLNIAEDHLDWYDGPDGMRDYAADKARIFERVQRACVYNLADAATEEMVREADVVEGARAVGFTLGTPSGGNVGVVEDLLVDRAFIEERATSAAELCTLDDLASPAPHFVANALAAAALARAHGVSQQAVRDGLRAFRPDGHRIALVAEADGITWVDDSKATNPHAAQSSLRRLRPGRLGRRRTGQGCPLRRPRRRRPRAAARRRAARPGPPGHRRRSFATRARCAGHRCGRRRDWGPDGAGGRRCRRARQVRGHRAAGAGLRLHGHVRQLRPRGDAFAAAVTPQDRTTD